MSPKPSEPGRRLHEPTGDDAPIAEPSVFVSAPAGRLASARRWHWFALGFLAVVLISHRRPGQRGPGSTPGNRTRSRSSCRSHFHALAAQDSGAARHLATVEERCWPSARSGT